MGGARQVGGALLVWERRRGREITACGRSIMGGMGRRDCGSAAGGGVYRGGKSIAEGPPHGVWGSTAGWGWRRRASQVGGASRVPASPHLRTVPQVAPPPGLRRLGDRTPGEARPASRRIFGGGARSRGRPSFSSGFASGLRSGGRTREGILELVGRRARRWPATT